MIYYVKLLSNGFSCSDAISSLALLLSLFTFIFVVYDRIQAYRKQLINLRFTIMDKDNDSMNELLFVTICFINESSVPITITNVKFNPARKGRAPAAMNKYENGTLRIPEKQLPLSIAPYSSIIQKFEVNFGGNSSNIVVHQNLKISVFTSRGTFSTELRTSCDNFTDFWYLWKAKCFRKPNISMSQKLQ